MSGRALSRNLFSSYDGVEAPKAPAQAQQPSEMQAKDSYPEQLFQGAHKTFASGSSGVAVVRKISPDTAKLTIDTKALAFSRSDEEYEAELGNFFDQVATGDLGNICNASFGECLIDDARFDAHSFGGRALLAPIRNTCVPMSSPMFNRTHIAIPPTPPNCENGLISFKSTNPKTSLPPVGLFVDNPLVAAVPNIQPADVVLATIAAPLINDGIVEYLNDDYNPFGAVPVGDALPLSDDPLVLTDTEFRDMCETCFSMDDEPMEDDLVDTTSDFSDSATMVNDEVEDDEDPEYKANDDDFEVSTEKTKYKNRSVPGNSVGDSITMADLRPVFHLNLKEASETFGIGTTLFKGVCRRHGIQNWPQRQITSLELLKSRLKTSHEVGLIAFQSAEIDDEQRELLKQHIDYAAKGYAIAEKVLNSLIRDPQFPLPDVINELRQWAFKNAHIQKVHDNEEAKAENKLKRAAIKAQKANGAGCSYATEDHLESFKPLKKKKKTVKKAKSYW